MTIAREDTWQGRGVVLARHIAPAVRKWDQVIRLKDLS